MANSLSIADREYLYRSRDALRLVKGGEEADATFYRLKDAAELVMGVESSCEKLYRVLADKPWGKDVQEFFRNLAAEEAEHHSAFASLCQSSQVGAADGDWSAREAQLRSTFHNAAYGWPDGTSGGLLQALSATLFHGQTFGWPGNTLASAQKTRGKEQGLRLAIEFEKDTLVLLYNLSDIVVDEDQELLDRVIAEDRAHVRLLSERL